MPTFQDKFVVSIKAAQKTEGFRFIKPDGTLGGAHGIILRGAEQNEMAAVMLVGIATVDIATGQTIAAGDFVVGDATGKATKSTATPPSSNGYCVANTASANGVVEVTIK